MAEEEKKKKGFFKEFKEFISRGNVLDLAIGIIIGGAFTAIVTALCDHVLKPIVNWILAAIVGTNSMEGIYTYLKKAWVDGIVNGTVDLENSIYIDWGSLINAVINFLLVALILFLIIKVINHIHEHSKEIREKCRAEDEKDAEKSEAVAETPEKAPEAPKAQEQQPEEAQAQEVTEAAPEAPKAEEPQAQEAAEPSPEEEKKEE